MKGIILAGGCGSRLSPITNYIPKEMFPLGKYPIIHYVIKEMVDVGCTDICIVINKDKNTIIDYVIDTFKYINFSFIAQKKHIGIGGALILTKNFINNDPFILSLGDVVLEKKSTLLKDMIDKYNKENKPVISVELIHGNEAYKYGIVDNNELIEKPTNYKEEFAYAILGRYILTPEIIDILNKETKSNEELQLTNSLNKYKSFIIHKCTNSVYDCGMFNYLNGTTDYLKAFKEFSK